MNHDDRLPGSDADDRTLLHLSRRHRLSTTFNFYAHISTDAVMRDIQENLLFVIRNRCEGRR